MCKGWFKKKEDQIPAFTKNTGVEIVCGNYPGTVNDLAGPPYDMDDVKNKILSYWPHYSFRAFKDTQATTERLLGDLQEGVNRIEFGDLLLFINDNCFSESNTKNFNSPKILGHRYCKVQLPPREKIKSATKANNYLAMSACLDHETASDAQFEHPNGAYTYCLLKTLRPGITYLQWHEETKALLKELGFRQTPTIEGPANLQNRLVFEGNVTLFYLSSHGTTDEDLNGDEADKKDEGPYLYNGFVSDDQINAIIATNPILI